ncbi:LysM peptidoglycan-binding domain-containing protein [Sanguibacter antarcticus]|uniref:LysM domain-containing protein n=1 Tax=Sanguibacter antarcticus TaxID=372484 RepID=A0A2A9E149_9MICO|nr:hypothetical protein [Sanguibacter antarcticus]PFG32573.1 hypothetical protein ATL42_0413 [Sanguibacter antarcticus]
MKSRSTPSVAIDRTSLAKAAGGSIALGLVTLALAARLVTTSASLDLAVLQSGSPTASTLAPLVEVPLLGIGCVVAAWWSLSLVLVTVVLLAHAAGLQSALLVSFVRAVAPSAVRRLAVAGIGAGLVLTAGPAVAAEPIPDLGWVSTGQSTPETPVENNLTTSPAGPSDALLPTEDMTPASTTVTVASGDTLWSITGDLLGPEASDAQIAAAWPTVHAANAQTIGADPNVILVGQQLVAPPDLTAP